MKEGTDTTGKFVIEGDELPPIRLNPGKRSLLLRKANELFNSGQKEIAARIYLTLGDRTGLILSGDFFYSRNRIADALQMYKNAPAPGKYDKILEDISLVIKHWLKEK